MPRTRARPASVVRSPIAPRGHTSRLVACLLALTVCLLIGNIGLTALYLGANSAVEGQFTTDAATVTSARRFYDAVNAAIRTGETTPVAALLAPEFIDSSRSVGAPAGSAEVLARLVRLRALAPELTLRVDDVSALPVPGEVLVHLTVAGGATASFLGLAPPRELTNWGWGPVETLRIMDGLIVERWSTSIPAMVLEPLSQTTLPGGIPPTQWVVALLRITVEAESAFTIDNGEVTRDLLIESGSLTVTVEQPRARGLTPNGSGMAMAAPSPVAAAAPRKLAPGDSLLAIPWGSYSLVNTGSSPGVLLAVVRVPTWENASTAEAFGWRVRLMPMLATDQRSGIQEELLTIALVPGTVGNGLAVGRVTLAPRETLTWPPLGRLAILAVAQGQLQVSAPREIDTVRADGRSWSDEEMLLQGGDGTVVSAAQSMTWRATSDEPASILIVTLGPSP
jgi:hypothetical protein